MVQARLNPLLWVGLLLAPIYLLAAPAVDRRERRHILYALLWSLCALAGVAMTRRLDAHYFLAALAPLSLLAGLVVVGVLQTPSQAASKTQILSVLLVAVVALFPIAILHLMGNGKLVYNHLLRGQPWPTQPVAETAAYLRQNLPPGEFVYVADTSALIYLMLDQAPPSRYVAPYFLVDEWYEPIIGENQVDMVDGILARKPLYVVRQDPPTIDATNQAVLDRLDGYLAASYRLELSIATRDAYSGQAATNLIYRRNDGNSNQQ
jgi:hypothetical protein